MAGGGSCARPPPRGGTGAAPHAPTAPRRMRTRSTASGSAPGGARCDGWRSPGSTSGRSAPG
eukprot:3309659-Lingulodinium_polyedra.AAC.1